MVAAALFGVHGHTHMNPFYGIGPSDSHCLNEYRTHVVSGEVLVRRKKGHSFYAGLRPETAIKWIRMMRVEPPSFVRMNRRKGQLIESLRSQYG